MARISTNRSHHLARRSGVPLYRQIYDHFRHAIARGQLRPGDRMPPIRTLAHQFATARGTIDAAYAMLAGEGYIVGRGPAGTIVSPDLEAGAIAATAAGPRAAAPTEHAPYDAPRPLQMGLPALDAFPRKLWANVMAREARRFTTANMLYPDRAGLPALRRAIAGYLATSRGITCTWQQVLVTAGFQGGLDLVTRTLLHRDDRVWIEDPCYPPVPAALAAAGAKLVPVKVDAEGLSVAEGLRLASDARLAVTTPSHQSPLGVALSLPRRLALLRWADDADAYVIEDDYDSEFRFTGRPLPALKSLDRRDRVIYTGSFSKVLFPGLRLGYLVLPEKLFAPLADACERQTAGHALFQQQVVATFMTEGHFARHLKRMRKLYASRRRAMVEALRAAFGDRVAIDLQPGGMHLLFRLRGNARDTSLARRAQAAGFGVEALSTRMIRHRGEQGLLIGFANVAEREAAATVRRLAHAFASR
jgi:GntR family transcriptional regulator / MocR family aminotransferase